MRQRWDEVDGGGRRRGCSSIQAAKTRIHNRDVAQQAWRGYAAWLEDFRQAELREKLQEYLAEWDPYGEIDDTEPLAAEIEQQALQELFDLIVQEPAYKADRKGLKFLLNRFLENRSDYAVKYCLANFGDLADLSLSCAEYLSSFANREDIQQTICGFVSSPECIFEWQAMHLIASVQNADRLRPELVTLALKVSLDRNRDLSLRSVCVDLVARHGTEDHVRELCRYFTKEPYEEVRSSIVVASRRLQQAERRSFLAACRGFSPTLDAAVTLVW